MDFTNKYTNNHEEKILLRKTDDLIRRSEKTYSVLYSHFLTPAEQTLLAKVEEFYGVITFDGGYPDAERRLCRVQTEEYAADEGTPYVLYSITATAPDADISHRDVLGSLMGLGIKREMIGDIMAGGRTAQFFCHRSVADYIETSLTKIARYHVELKRAALTEIPEPKTKSITINISSLRLDCICVECFGLSRTKAAEQIRKGLVSVNWLVCDNTSKELSGGEKISMRGKGKVKFAGVTGQSKKGRLFAEILKYN